MMEQFKIMKKKNKLNKNLDYYVYLGKYENEDLLTITHYPGNLNQMETHMKKN